MSGPCGYHGKILWIDLSRKTSHLEERGEVFWRRYVGGGLLAARLLLEKTAPGIDPLGPENLLILSSSVVAGHEAAGIVRFTTAAKSPLTGGIGETRTEGPWGIALKGSGADALVFTGQAERPTVVVVNDGRAEFLDAADLWGTTVVPTTEALQARFGKEAHVAAIGPAGENRVRFASIVTDYTFQASRMGMGAVMGAKNLKAVVLTPGPRPPVFDPAAVNTLTAAYASQILQNDLTKWQKVPPGFSAWLYLHGLDAALCANNYRECALPGIEAFKTERFLERYVRAAPCPGCPNDCIKIIHPRGCPGLDSRASGIHQEISGTMGANLGISDLDVVLRANNLCNQHGLDPTSLGFTISFAMELFEQGILSPADNEGQRLCFGDGEAALAMVEKIAQRRGLGHVLAEGTRQAARTIGRGAEAFAMHAKGLEMVCFEPRSQTNLALGYATAPIGPRYDICEHDWDFDTQVGWAHSLNLARTLGILERIPMNRVGPEKVRNFKVLFNLWSAADALDFCIFAVAPTRLLSLPQMAEMLRSVTGWETSDYEILRIGERRNHLMRWYNCREGLTAADDGLPDRFYEQPIQSGPRKGDRLDRMAFHQAIRTFYAMMGWDEQGKPTEATLYDHGLEWALKGGGR
jgi:aldehyde:ferredoxin oxidoreductase